MSSKTGVWRSEHLWRRSIQVLSGRKTVRGCKIAESEVVKTSGPWPKRSAALVKTSGPWPRRSSALAKTSGPGPRRSAALAKTSGPGPKHPAALVKTSGPGPEHSSAPPPWRGRTCRHDQVSPLQGEPDGARETWGAPCVAALLVRPQAIRCRPSRTGAQLS